MMDRLNTKDLMIRKSWHIDDTHFCVLCDQHELETRDHLFFCCPFAQECWTRANIHWDLAKAMQERIITAKKTFQRSMLFGNVCMCDLEYVERK
jgi:hypothetical protein